MPPGWRGGCFWEAGAGGPASPLAVIGFSFSSPCTKGPLRAVGKLLCASASSRRSSQLLKSHSSPAQARGSGDGICRAKAKETAGAGSNRGAPGASPSPARGRPCRPPGPSPGLQPHLFRCHPASITGAMLPWPPWRLPAQGAARSRAPARPQLPVSLGGDKGAILQGWHSRGCCHQRPGSRTVPNPTALPSPVPSSPWGPPRSATSPAHGPGAVPASHWLRAAKPWGTPLPKSGMGQGSGTGIAFPKCAPGPAS